MSWRDGEKKESIYTCVYIWILTQKSDLDNLVILDLQKTSVLIMKEFLRKDKHKMFLKHYLKGMDVF